MDRTQKNHKLPPLHPTSIRKIKIQIKYCSTSNDIKPDNIVTKTVKILKSNTVDFEERRLKQEILKAKVLDRGKKINLAIESSVACICFNKIREHSVVELAVY